MDGVGWSGIGGGRPAAVAGAQGKLPLTLACWDYDRTRALMDGRVKVDGAELNYRNLPVEETLFRRIKRFPA